MKDQPLHHTALLDVRSLYKVKAAQNIFDIISHYFRFRKDLLPGLMQPTESRPMFLKYAVLALLVSLNMFFIELFLLGFK